MFVSLVRGFVLSVFVAGNLYAYEFANIATISQTVNNRVCVFNINGDSSEAIDCGASAPYVSSAGNVGIGTTGPTEKLHINGGDLRVNYARLIGSGLNNASQLTFNANYDSATDAYIPDYNGGSTAGMAVIKMRSGGQGGLDFYNYRSGTASSVSLTEFYPTLSLSDATGYVGVGTTSPVAGLHVYRAANAVPAVFESGVSTARITVQDTGTTDATRVGLGSAGNELTLFSNALERVRIDAGGNVGIGTTNPTWPLDVSATSVAGRFTSYRTDADAGDVLVVKRPNSVGGLMRFEDNSTTIGGVDYGASDVRFYAISKDVILSGDDVYLRSAGTDSLVVKASGKVGIGTTAPNRSLEISASGPIIQLTDGRGPAAYGNITLANDSGGFRIASYTSANAFISNDYLINKGASGATDHIWRIGNSEKMRIDSDGELGIGTAAPSYKLHVEGTAYATGAAGSLSDRRHKKEIVGLPDTGLAIVAALRPVSFLWKEPQDKPMEGQQLGFIAQEVEEVLPEAVMTQDNEEKTKGLKYNVFMPVVVKAMQEQQSQIELLQKENDSLRERLDAIEAKLN